MPIPDAPKFNTPHAEALSNSSGRLHQIVEEGPCRGCIHLCTPRFNGRTIVACNALDASGKNPSPQKLAAESESTDTEPFKMSCPNRIEIDSRIFMPILSGNINSYVSLRTSVEKGSLGTQAYEA